MNEVTIFDIIKSNDYLILDTETTGLDSTSAICQIAVIDSNGKVLMDTLVKPVNPIPTAAIEIHGITNEMVKDAKPFPVRELFDLLDEQNVIIYNAGYDVSMLYRSENAIGNPLGVEWREVFKSYCAMEAFAEIYGEWNDYRGNYKWQKLQTACEYYKIHMLFEHSAYADAMATLAVCKSMVRKQETDEAGS